MNGAKDESEITRDAATVLTKLPLPTSASFQGPKNSALRRRKINPSRTEEQERHQSIRHYAILHIQKRDPGRTHLPLQPGISSPKHHNSRPDIHNHDHANRDWNKWRLRQLLRRLRRVWRLWAGLSCVYYYRLCLIAYNNRICK